MVSLKHAAKWFAISSILVMTASCRKPMPSQLAVDTVRIKALLNKRKAIELSTKKPIYRDFILNEMTAILSEPIYAYRVSTKDHFRPTKDLGWSVAMQRRAIELDEALRPEGARMPVFSYPGGNSSVGPMSDGQTGAYYFAESIVHCIQDPHSKKWVAIGFRRDHTLLGSSADYAKDQVQKFPTIRINRTPRSTFLNPEDIDWAFGVDDYTKVMPYTRQPSKRNKA